MSEKRTPLLSIFLEDNGMICLLNTNEFDDPAYWGMVLADIVGHIVNGYEKQGLSRAVVRSRVIFALSEELEKPTSEELEKPTSEAREIEGEWTPAGFVPVLAGEGEA